MQMLCNPDSRRAVISVNSDQDQRIPDFLSNEVKPLSIAIVDRQDSSFTSSTRLWNPRDLTGYTIRAAFGKAFQPPVAGTFTLTFGANTTAAIDYNATSGQVQTALNAIASVISAGGVTVSGQDGYFIITFVAVGTRTQITIDEAGLAPAAIGEEGTLVDGSVNRKEVQSVRYFQNPGAYANLGTASSDSDSTVDVLQVGGGGKNHKIRVTLTNNPYDGAFSMVIFGVDSSLIRFDASETTFLEILEAMEVVGAGNVEVMQEAVGVWVVAFKGTLANTNIGTIDASGGLLRALPTLSGDLDLRTTAISMLLGNSASTVAIFEIEATPPAGQPIKLFRGEYPLLAAALATGSLTPQSLAGFLGNNFRIKGNGDLQFLSPTDGKYYTAIGTGTGPGFTLGWSDTGEV